MKESLGHNVDRLLIVFIVAAVIGSSVFAYAGFQSNRTRIKKGIVVSIYASCKQANVLLTAALDNPDMPLTNARRVAINGFLRNYYAPLNEALEGLHASKCRVPQL